MNAQRPLAMSEVDAAGALTDLTPVQDWAESKVALSDAAQALIDAAQGRMKSVACFDFVPSNYYNAWQCLMRLADLCADLCAGRAADNPWLVQTRWSRHVQSLASPGEIRFCEWGSGWGVAAGLASLAGFAASGIELDEALCEASRSLLGEHGLETEIRCGSYYQIDQLADIYYVYAWPSQRDQLLNRFLQLAPEHALLLLCDGQDRLRVVARTN